MGEGITSGGSILSFTVSAASIAYLPTFAPTEMPTVAPASFANLFYLPFATFYGIVAAISAATIFSTFALFFYYRSRALAKQRALSYLAELGPQQVIAKPRKWKGATGEIFTLHFVLRRHRWGQLDIQLRRSVTSMLIAQIGIHLRLAQEAYINARMVIYLDTEFGSQKLQ